METENNYYQVLSPQKWALTKITLDRHDVKYKTSGAVLITNEKAERFHVDIKNDDWLKNEIAKTEVLMLNDIALTAQYNKEFEMIEKFF